MASLTPRILLVGATGYVGGEDTAKKLRDAYGDRVDPIQWTGLTDTVFIADTAVNYDIIINTGSGFVAEGAKAFVTELARRIKPGALRPWLLHISGCTNLADRPLTQTGYPDREWNDENGNEIYEFLKQTDAREPYPQRTTEVGVLTAAEETGVQAMSVNTSCIFGAGTGLFNQQGLVIPVVMRYVVKYGYAFKLNDAANFHWVHVEDLAEIYVLLIRTILERPDRAVGYLPSGDNGILFPTVGHVLHTEIAQRCLVAAFDAGVLPREGTPKEKEIRVVPLQELADKSMTGIPALAEQAWAGNKAQVGTMAKKLLGWKPIQLQKEWE